MNANRLVIGLVLLAACPSSEKKDRTRAEFCQDWADAACSDDAVSACQAESADACRHSQEDFCRSLVPEASFSDAHGDACLDAVSDAYADASLRGAELATVLRLGPPCDELLTGSKDRGDSCTSRRDCDASSGFDCLKKGSASKGTCQIPEEVGGGRDCSAAQKVCAAGFYCDGEHCVEGKELGEDCSVDTECGSGGFCGTDGSCQPRIEVDNTCTSDAQCASGICYAFDDGTVCTDRIVLSRSEPLCEDLR
jgi:hypothetical protein